MTSLDAKLDACDGTHFGIAQVTYELLKKEFLYSDENWYEYNEHTRCWCKIQRDHRLRVMISTVVSSEFSNRSQYWLLKSYSPDTSIFDKSKFIGISKSLAKIATKLKNYNFKGSIIKECKCLFYVDEVPLFI